MRVSASLSVIASVLSLAGNVASATSVTVYDFDYLDPAENHAFLDNGDGEIFVSPYAFDSNAELTLVIPIKAQGVIPSKMLVYDWQSGAPSGPPIGESSIQQVPTNMTYLTYSARMGQKIAKGQEIAVLIENLSPNLGSNYWYLSAVFFDADPDGVFVYDNFARGDGYGAIVGRDLSARISIVGSIAAVPEPAVYLLMLIGLITLPIYSTKKRL